MQADYGRCSVTVDQGLQGSHHSLRGRRVSISTASALHTRSSRTWKVPKRRPPQRRLSMKLSGMPCLRQDSFPATPASARLNPDSLLLTKP